MMVAILYFIVFLLFCFTTIVSVLKLGKVLAKLISEGQNSKNEYPLMVKKLNVESVLPVRNNSNDAGLDLFSLEEVEIESGCGKMISTGIAIELPYNTVGMICDRSSMGKKGFKVHGGIVDEGYRGEVKVVLWNHSNEKQKINKGDKIAQVLIIPVYYSQVWEVDELNSADRGENGFGSSGK